MADVLPIFPRPPERRRSIVSQYGQFCDGRIYRVVQGVDFPATSKQRATSGFYTAARRRGLRARVQVQAIDPLTLIVQALPREEGR